MIRKNFWQTERIKLRAAEEPDLNILVKYGKSPDSVRQWYEDEMLFPYSEKETKELFLDDINNYYKDDKKLFIIEAAGGTKDAPAGGADEAAGGPVNAPANGVSATVDFEYAGQLSVWHANRRSGVFRHGIFLEELFRGRGLAKEALVIAMDFYFNELGYRKVCPYIYPYNANSLKFHEKLGFTFEARLKEEHFTRNGYHDVLYYSLFKDDFNALHRDALWSAQ